MKTIIIRNLSDATICSIDEKAKKARMSRQAYLVEFMENAFASRTSQNQIDMLLKVISVNTNILSDVSELLEQLQERGDDYE